MNIFQFFRILWARRVITVIALGTAIIAAILVVMIVPPRYQASSRLMLDIVKPDPVTGEVVQSGFARAYVKTQIELIKDYRIAGKVVDAMGWTGSPELATAYSNSGSQLDFRRWLAQDVIDRTDADLIEGSNILEISYTGPNPDSAAKISDAIREAYVEQTSVFKQQGAARNAEWFRQQTVKLRTDLTTAEKLKADFERKNNIVLNDDNSDPESARLSSIAGSSAVPPVNIPAAAPVPIGVSPSQTQLAQIDAAIATATQTLGPNHPELINLKRQREIVANNASRELAAARAAASAGRGGSSGPSVGALFSAQQSRVLAQRGLIAEARQLQVDVNVLREQLQHTAKRAEELEQESQSTETGMTLLGNAVAPQDPSFPKIPLLIGGGIGMGLALGVLVSLLVELLNRRVRGEDDLAIAGVPVLGMMPRKLPRKPGGLLPFFQSKAEQG